MKIRLPYGSAPLCLELPDHQVKAVLESRIGALKAELSENEIVQQSMENPLGSPRLSTLAVGKKNAVIIVSDHTRPVPSRHIIPFMLAELRAKNPEIDITLLVATGFHRLTTRQELIDKLGTKIVDEEKIVIHDSKNRSENIKIGVLPSGADLVINKTAATAELLVAEGFIEPHFFAGFSGGRKSVLPGICDETTVLGNHCAAFIDSPRARTGILEGNPLHVDMTAAAKMARLAYIVNVIIDEDKKVVASFAGDPFAAHEKGCAFLSGYCRVDGIPADVIITSNGGAPLDQNIYQCVKGMTAAEAAAGDGSVIILCAECADGTGSDDLYQVMRDAASADQLLAAIRKIPQAETRPDQWEYQILARILSKHPVIFVTKPELKSTIEDMKMIYAPDLPAAIAQAREIAGVEADFTIIPNGISVIVESGS